MKGTTFIKTEERFALELTDDDVISIVGEWFRKHYGNRIKNGSQVETIIRDSSGMFSGMTITVTTERVEEVP